MAPTTNSPYPTSEALTRSVFLANSSSTDRYGIERVKPRLMEYLVAVQRRALMQNRTVKVVGSHAQEGHRRFGYECKRSRCQKENATVTLLKEGEIPPRPRVPVPVPRPLKSSQAKVIKALTLLFVEPPGMNSSGIIDHLRLWPTFPTHRSRWRA